MATYTNFCARSGGSNLNAGTRTGNTTEPGTSADFTYVGGTWVNATRVFTVAGGNPLTDGVAVDDFANINGAYIARVTARDATTITLAASGHGTNPADGTYELRIGGALQGPNGTSVFPLNILSTNAGGLNAAGNKWRLNLKNDASYAVTGALTTAPTGAQVQGTIEGYTTNYGDGGEAVIDGGTAGAAYVMLTINFSVSVWKYVKFQNNGATGSANLVVVATSNGNHTYFFKCRFTGSRGNGLVNNTGATFVGCKFDNNNLSNTASQGGMGTTSQSNFTRCRFTGNTGTNSSGARVTGSLVSFNNCIFDGNGGRGLDLNTTDMSRVVGCDVYNNGSDGIIVGTTFRPHHVESCNLVKNGGAGINANSNAVQIFDCGFGSGTQANTGGAISNSTNAVEVGSQTYPADVTPWADPANGDFDITLAAAKNAGIGAFYDAAFAGFPDIGSAQHQEVSGGGFAVIRRGGLAAKL